MNELFRLDAWIIRKPDGSYVQYKKAGVKVAQVYTLKREAEKDAKWVAGTVVPVTVVVSERE